jgi:hypothetical protein
LDLGVRFVDLLKKGCSESFTSEREFREKVVIRLLEYLGWDEIYDVKIEFPISTGQSTLRVDYLVGDQTNKFALEIKTPDISIDAGTKPRLQILSYLNLLKGVRYGVLYNGKKMLIFMKGVEEPIITWNCGDPPLSVTYLSKISFPGTLNAAFPYEWDSSKMIRKSKESIDPLTITQRRIKIFKSIGYFSLISLIFSFVFIAIGEQIPAIVSAGLFTISIIAFLFDYMILAFIYRKRRK